MNNENIEQLIATLRSGYFDIAGIEDTISALQELKNTQKLLQEKTQLKWIDVKKALPTKTMEFEYKYIPYLCYLPQYKTITIAFYGPGINNWRLPGYKQGFINVSHWMPMPEPPNEEGEIDNDQN